MDLSFWATSFSHIFTPESSTNSVMAAQLASDPMQELASNAKARQDEGWGVALASQLASSKAIGLQWVSNMLNLFDLLWWLLVAWKSHLIWSLKKLHAFWNYEQLFVDRANCEKLPGHERNMSICRRTIFSATRTRSVVIPSMGGFTATIQFLFSHEASVLWVQQLQGMSSPLAAGAWWTSAVPPPASARGRAVKSSIGCFVPNLIFSGSFDFLPFNVPIFSLIFFPVLSPVFFHFSSVFSPRFFAYFLPDFIYCLASSHLLLDFSRFSHIQSTGEV